ncbi:carboxyl-terminal processing protease [Rhizobiales bacterium GAS113]|nr:carboxyl-terminal processing protease [Rhizobiales bacterium GAS113]
MRKSSLLLLGVLLGTAAATLGLGTLGLDTLGLETRLLVSAPAQAASAGDTYRRLSLLGDVFERIRADYVEKPDDGKLVEAAINGMLTSLDPHSNYMDAKSFRDMQVDTKGEFGGVGIQITVENGVVKVVAATADTPAARAGILADDTITRIDGETTRNLTLDQVAEKIRGAVKSSVKLTVIRKDRKEPLEVRLTREIIQVKSVKFRQEDDIGYIQITQFSEQTTDNLRAAIESLKKDIGDDKLKGFVLDLRNDPGGLLDEAIGVCDTFLDKGEIVSTRGRNPEDTRRWDARHGDVTKGKRLVLLINGGSASASEIVAGALQDHKRATLLGTRSFGKGSVQTIIPVGKDAAIRLTTARYYTPSGRSIQAKGIEPDIKVLEAIPDELKGKDEAKGEASLPGHLSNDKGEDLSASQAYVASDPAKDTQLIAALELLHDKAVTGLSKAGNPG